MIDAVHALFSLLNAILNVAVTHGSGSVPPITC
jgi:hypothetical protein